MTADSNVRQCLRLLAAGSLRRVFGVLIPLLEEQSRITVDATFGPAGLLRQKIEAGEAFDLFASASAAHPSRLHEAGLCETPVALARNGFCAIARRDLRLDPATLIDAMLDPAIAVATSTPGADPSGDYAQTVFEKIEAERPGQGLKLKRKARHLLGGDLTSNVPAGLAPAEWLVATGQADIVLGYRSGATVLTDDGPLVAIDLPESCAVTADYTFAIRTAAGEPAHRAAAFLVSDAARAIFLRHGFQLPPDGRDNGR